MKCGELLVKEEQLSEEAKLLKKIKELDEENRMLKAALQAQLNNRADTPDNSTKKETEVNQTANQTTEQNCENDECEKSEENIEDAEFDGNENDLEKLEDEAEELYDPTEDEDTDWVTQSENDSSPRQRMFVHPFSIKGRIRRKEYVLSVVIEYVYIRLLFLLFGGGHLSTFTFMLSIPGIWFIVAQGTKRCHDINVSGWIQVIPFYPIILIFSRGDVGANKYGDSPK
jgi:uncharacterized membrane protein YhaH (DUF805 family)